MKAHLLHIVFKGQYIEITVPKNLNHFVVSFKIDGVQFADFSNIFSRGTNHDGVLLSSKTPETKNFFSV